MRQNPALFSRKEREVDTTVPLLFFEIAVVPERMFITMLQDEIIARVEDVQSEYPVR